MKHRLATFCFTAACLALIVGPVSAYWQTRVIYKPTGGFTPACTESADWYARLASSGNSLSTADKTKHDPFICGLVTDGVLADLNFLYSFLTSTLAQSYINIPNSSFTATSVGSPTFTANAGVVGGSGKAVNTNFTPSTNGGALMTLNDIGMGVCILNNRTSNAVYMSIGAETFIAGVSQTYLIPLGSPLTSYAGLNSASGSGIASTTRTTAQGLWTSASDANPASNKIYQGASDVTNGAYGSVRTSLSDQTIYILAYHGSSNGISNESSDTHALAFGGKSLSGTKVTAFQGRVATLLSAYSLSGC